MGPSLKCQFCPLDFSSAYKMIPHVYFGHRKKISRQVREGKSILLKCPAPSCDFKYSAPVEDCRPEVIFSNLAEMFLVVEDHIVSVHTNESKLVICPYCNKDLTNCVYWVHLEEHMNSSPSPVTPGTPMGKSSLDTAAIQSPPVTPESNSEGVVKVEEPSPTIPKKAVTNKPTKEASPSDLVAPILGGSKRIETESQGVKSLIVLASPEEGRSSKRSYRQRHQILKDLEEIEKKIALKQKEEVEANLKMMENKELKTESHQKILLEEQAKEEQVDFQENNLTAPSDIQMKVEKQIVENILQTDNSHQELSAEIRTEELESIEANKEEFQEIKNNREFTGECETGVRRRSISGEKQKRNSVWNKEQPSWSVVKMPGISTVVETKVKPVLTEEMERNIIYGNFKVKESHCADNRLGSVRREIENRFKDEEDNRRRIIEHKTKTMQQEREKKKIIDEKLRKERGQLKEERKRGSKQRRKESNEIKVEMEMEKVAEVENLNFEADIDNIESNSPMSSLERSISRSPDHYQKIGVEISKMLQKNEIETEVKNFRKRQHDGDFQSSEIFSKFRRRSDGLGTSPVLTRVLSYHGEEEDDEIELMMKDFQERQAKSKSRPTRSSLLSDSLSLIQNSYQSELKDTSKQSDCPKLLSHVISSNLQCNLCEEKDAGGPITFKSAYQLLAHIFLSHRKKIVSISRRSREMSLACPEKCGFVTPASSDGVSIDYFNSKLGTQLAKLCDHLRQNHTGEDVLEQCSHCGLNFDLSHVSAWQHLANHIDTRRAFCGACNSFPFRNEEHRCSEGSDSVKTNPVISSRKRKVEMPKDDRSIVSSESKTGEALRLEVDILMRKSEVAVSFFHRKFNFFIQEKEDLTEEEDRLILLDIFIHLALIDEVKF